MKACSWDTPFQWVGSRTLQEAVCGGQGQRRASQHIPLPVVKKVAGLEGTPLGGSRPATWSCSFLWSRVVTSSEHLVSCPGLSSQSTAGPEPLGDLLCSGGGGSWLLSPGQAATP